MDDHAPKRTVTFRAQLDERGGFYPEDARTVRARLARWAKRRVYVSVSLEPKRRSLTQNAYLWGVVYRTIAEWSGHDDEEIHAAMKDMFIVPKPMILPNGVEIERRSTADLDSADFSEYVSKVKRFAAENGLYIPEPNEEEKAL